MKKRYLTLGAAAILAVACTKVDISMPLGPVGPQGEQGIPGLSAFEVWQKALEDGTILDWDKALNDVANFFKYLKGKDGIDGVDGKDGKDAYTQWVEYISTGDVDDPHIPGAKWSASRNTMADFWLFLTGAKGENGSIPVVGPNGNWFIDGEDTGFPSRGEKGEKGDDGKDAVAPEVKIGDNGNWFVNGTDTGVKARGDKGETGDAGRDGHTPAITIGENGNWYVDGKDTGKPAKGADGLAPEVAIGENGNWYINGQDTGKPAFGRDGKDGQDGADGKTPAITIGENGNWFIDGQDTGKTSKGEDGADGQDGADGETPALTIGENGNWYINGQDTGKPAKGTDGARGDDGKSAYELWKEFIADGNADDPHHEGEKWDPTHNTEADFFAYLTGKDGQDGKDGGVRIEKGKYNVLLQYFSTEVREFVDPKDGSATFYVYDEEGTWLGDKENEKYKNGAPDVTITKLADVTPATPIVAKNGVFKLKRADLPEWSEAKPSHYGSSTISVNGEQKITASNTNVPNRVNVRIVIYENGTYNYLYNPSLTNPPADQATDDVHIYVTNQRQIDGVWQDWTNKIPYGNMINKVGILKNNDKQPASIDDIEIIDSGLWHTTSVTPSEKYVRSTIYLYRSIHLTLSDFTNADPIAKSFYEKLSKRVLTMSQMFYAFTIGDGEGVLNDYGALDQIVPEVVQECPIHLSPKFDLNQTELVVEHGVTTLKGAFDVKTLPPFRPLNKAPYSNNKEHYYTKNTVQNWKWMIPEERPGSQLPEDRRFAICVERANTGTAGTMITQSEFIKDGASFALEAITPGSYIWVRPIYSTKSGNEYTLNASGEYVCTYAYQFVQEGDDYYLIDVDDTTVKHKLKVTHL